MNNRTTKVPNFDAVPALDWSRIGDDAYMAEYRRGYVAAVGIPPIIGADDEDEVRIPKTEHDELKRTVAEKDKEVRRLKRDAKATEDRIDDLEQRLADADHGGDEAKKLEARIARIEKKAEQAEDRAERAEAKLETSSKERSALDVATRLNFRNPSRAVRLLDSEDLETEDDTERALERLAREEPYMVTSKKQREVTDPRDRRRKGDPEDEDDRRKRSEEDEPRGAARIKRYYDEQSEDGDDDKGEDGESD